MQATAVENRIEKIRRYTLDDEETLLKEICAFVEDARREYDGGATATYDIEAKRAIVTYWSMTGITLAELHRRIGVPYKTLHAWHAGFDPVDWDGYRDKIVNEQMRAASKIVARRFGKVLESQLKATDAVSKSIQFVIAEIQKDMKALQDDKTLAVGDKRRRGRVRELSSMLSETSRSMKNIQDQQFAIFGVPSIQRETDPEKQTKATALTDGELENLSDDQIVRLLHDGEVDAPSS